MLKTLFNLFRKTDKNSLKTLQQRIEQGDAEAMYQLGRFYHIGKSTQSTPSRNAKSVHPDHPGGHFQ